MAERRLNILYIESQSRDPNLFAIALQLARVNAELNVVRDVRLGMALLNAARAGTVPAAFTAHDLVVLDLPQIGTATAIEFLTWCRASDCCQCLPVVLLSSLPDETEGVRAALGSGADRSFFKPAGLSELADTVRQMCAFAVQTRRLRQSTDISRLEAA